MRFEITHEIDAPFAAVERAVLSPDLATRLARRLTRIESIETLEHHLGEATLHRVLAFQATAPLAIFRGMDVARDAMSWQEAWTYRLADHAASWVVEPKEKYRRYFRSEGTYRLEASGRGRTRRVVVGDLEIQISVLRGFAERTALSEVRKTYDAEAATLLELSSLGGLKSAPTAFTS